MYEALTRKLERALEVEFQDKEILLSVILTENEKRTLEFHRLEFLGDAILKTFISKYYYYLNPDLSAHYLTTNTSCASTNLIFSKVFDSLHLGDFFKNKMSVKQKADIYEALVAAISIDKGMQVSEKFILDTLFHDRMKLEIENSCRHAKNIHNIEILAKKLGKKVSYKTIEEKGVFTVKLIVGRVVEVTATHKEVRVAKEIVVNRGLSILEKEAA